MRKTLLAIVSLSLLSACSDSDNEPVKEQPITGALAPTVAFTLTEIVMPEEGSFSLPFTTENAGASARVMAESNELIQATVDGENIIITSTAVDFHTNQTTLSVDISFGGQRTTSTVPVSVRNDSGLLVIKRNNALFSSLANFGEEELSLAAAVSDVSPAQSVMLDDDLEVLNTYIGELKKDAVFSDSSLSLSDALDRYLKNEITEQELSDVSAQSQLVFDTPDVMSVTTLMTPFVDFLNDFDASDTSQFFYSSEYDTFSRYINNPALGKFEEGRFTFDEDVEYLSFLLPVIAGTSPCTISSGESL